ncbi:MAG: hypothetical protein OK455_08390, partial [Thaumarchaeota archaeon]|nr:hypothetical protein [Nitrososphaerota archaeon]
ISGSKVVANVTLGLFPSALTFDASDSKVYVASANPAAAAGVLWQIADTTLFGNLTVGPEPKPLGSQSIIYDQLNGDLYVVNRASGSVTVIQTGPPTSSTISSSSTTTTTTTTTSTSATSTTSSSSSRSSTFTTTTSSSTTTSSGGNSNSTTTLTTTVTTSSSPSSSSTIPPSTTQQSTSSVTSGSPPLVKSGPSLLLTAGLLGAVGIALILVAVIALMKRRPKS